MLVNLITDISIGAIADQILLVSLAILIPILLIWGIFLLHDLDKTERLKQKLIKKWIDN